MVPGKPDPVTGGPNEELTRPLVRNRKYGMSFTEGCQCREMRVARKEPIN